MRFSTVLAATAFAAFTYAEEHVVKVGANGLKFEPSTITAAEGDHVIFEFYAKNHSVAQGAFNSPCKPSDGGFWSGFVPASGTTPNETTFMYTVANASAPIWVYCTQGSHCQSGMVAAINAPSTGNTLEKYINGSSLATENLSPTSAAGEGGMLMQGTSHSGTPSGSATPGASGAASTLNNGMAFTGLMSMFAFLMM
ncbi:Cupredoxin [Massariosphaeria phaeospora]|uniref:Cupredoxin n=1 Tax=Massariosphaeria phaeospora TaxID=100035 RepID=A0A7C8MUA1_9PLEO|nr:Cupredoxin [Massariosphaeria phaeospora]